MKGYTYKIDEFEPLSREIPADSDWGEHFSNDVGFTIRLDEKYFMSVFLDKRLIQKEKFLLIQEPEHIVARCISCVGEIWEVRAEMTGPESAGIVIYTHRGKALAAGALSLAEDEISYSAKTLYEGITNGIKFDYKVEGKVKTGSDGNEVYTGTISVTVSDKR